MFRNLFVKSSFVSFCLLFAFCFNLNIVFADEASKTDKKDAMYGIKKVVKKGYDEDLPDAVAAENELNRQIGFVIKTALSFTGVVLLVVIIYAGFMWLTAGGNTDKVDTSKKWISNGVIGMIIITAAYFLTDFVISSLG